MALFFKNEKPRLRAKTGGPGLFRFLSTFEPVELLSLFELLSRFSTIKKEEMSTSIAFADPQPKAVSRQPRRISKERFLLEYSDREDGFKYEWNDGLIEKTESMNQLQADFFFLLLDRFLKTAASKAGGGLITETDMDTTAAQVRRPDIAFYSGEQRKWMKKGQNQVPTWVAEVISPTDKAYKIDEKLEEYFRAGVQVVWHIFPASQKVEVYTSPDDVKICRAKTVCSGAPALPDFEITAEELFA